MRLRGEIVENSNSDGFTLIVRESLLDVSKHRNIVVDYDFFTQYLEQIKYKSIVNELLEYIETTSVKVYMYKSNYESTYNQLIRESDKLAKRFCSIHGNIEKIPYSSRIYSQAKRIHDSNKPIVCLKTAYEVAVGIETGCTLFLTTNKDLLRATVTGITKWVIAYFSYNIDLNNVY